MLDLKQQAVRKNGFNTKSYKVASAIGISTAVWYGAWPHSPGAPTCFARLSQIGPNSCHINNTENGATKSVKAVYDGKTWTRLTILSQTLSQIIWTLS